MPLIVLHWRASYLFTNDEANIEHTAVFSHQLETFNNSLREFLVYQSALNIIFNIYNINKKKEERRSCYQTLDRLFLIIFTNFNRFRASTEYICVYFSTCERYQSASLLLCYLLNFLFYFWKLKKPIAKPSINSITVLYLYLFLKP